MKQTAVEWLEKIRQGQKGQPFDDYEWEIAFNHAKEMEKDQIIDFAYVIVNILLFWRSSRLSLLSLANDLFCI